MVRLLPPGATLDPNTGVFQWTPGYNQDGSFDVAFTAHSGGLSSATQHVHLTVSPVNVAPVFGPLAGFAVAEAANGRLALDAMAQQLPDLVLMDVSMPEMDGFTACSELRRLPGGTRVPVIMMTGLDDVQSIERAFEVGATDFITKPINWAVLPHRVRYMMRASAAINELQQNILRRQEAEEEIRRLAYYDPLTGLPNRLLFVEQLIRAHLLAVLIVMLPVGVAARVWEPARYLSVICYPRGND